MHQIEVWLFIVTSVGLFGVLAFAFAATLLTCFLRLGTLAGGRTYRSRWATVVIHETLLTMSFAILSLGIVLAMRSVLRSLLPGVAWLFPVLAAAVVVLFARRLVALLRGGAPVMMRRYQLPYARLDSTPTGPIRRPNN